MSGFSGPGQALPRPMGGIDIFEKILSRDKWSTGSQLLPYRSPILHQRQQTVELPSLCELDRPCLMTGVVKRESALKSSIERRESKTSKRIPRPQRLQLRAETRREFDGFVCRWWRIGDRYGKSCEPVTPTYPTEDFSRICQSGPSAW